MERIYWGIVHFLVTQKKWNLVYTSQQFEEVWLLNGKDVYRLSTKTFDWTNHLHQDLIYVYSMGQQLAKQMRKAPLSIQNIYFSQQLPVDDWEYVVSDMSRTHSPDLFHVKTRIEQDEVIAVNRLMEELQVSSEEINGLRMVCEQPIEDIKYQIQQYLNKKQEVKKKVFEYGKPRVTNILIGVQIIIFLLMTVNGGSTNQYVLIEFGAKYNPLIDQGQWWRLVTSMFLHIGVLHLFMNMLALYYIGIQLERMIGNVKFIIVYFLSGIAGSYCSYLFTTGIAAGASGAIFGCFGALLVVSLLYKEYISKEVITNIVTLIVINLVFGVVVPNIDNAAHVGGLLAGTVGMFLLGVPKIQS